MREIKAFRWRLRNSIADCDSPSDRCDVDGLLMPMTKRTYVYACECVYSCVCTNMRRSAPRPPLVCGLACQCSVIADGIERVIFALSVSVCEFVLITSPNDVAQPSERNDRSVLRTFVAPSRFLHVQLFFFKCERDVLKYFCSDSISLFVC